MKIFNFIEFCNEEVGGVELIGHMGPNYGEEDNHKMIGPTPADVLRSDTTGKVYTQDEYQQAYFDYLKKGGTPLHGFNKENLETVLSFKPEIIS